MARDVSQSITIMTCDGKGMRQEDMLEEDQRGAQTGADTENPHRTVRRSSAVHYGA
jgi:hypothetical protein